LCSYGRALQEPALKAWQGNPQNSAATLQALYRRARLNGAARHGTYTPDMESC
jgi:fructose-bisphosphate aldolase class I